MTTDVRFLSAGDTALTVEFGDRAELALSAKVLALDRRLAALELPGVVEIMPTLRSLTVHYRPSETSAETLRAALLPLCSGLDEVSLAASRWRLPLHYGGSDGPDLAMIASRTGQTEEAVARLHASVPYRVYMIGFLPGQPYIGDLPKALELPRRDTPRVAVPAGSVAIATTMTVIYPWQSPGGWHIVGRTPARLFDAAQSPPSLLTPGDIVEFVPASEAEVRTLDARYESGEWRPLPEKAAEHDTIPPSDRAGVGHHRAGRRPHWLPALWRSCFRRS